MGFEDREYSQEEWKDSPPTEHPTSKWIVILAVVLYAMSAITMTARSAVVYDMIAMSAPDVLHGQVWRLVTFGVSNHPLNIIGLVFSLLITWRFGSELERMYGSRELLCYYIANSVFVSVYFTAWQFVVPLDAKLDGLYSMSLGLMALFATHFPRMEVCILPMITVQLRWLVAIYALFGLFPAFQMIQLGGGVYWLAYAAPVFSIGFALLYRHFSMHLSGVTDRLNPKAWMRAWRNRTARRNLRVYQPSVDHSNLDLKVDAILAKIHEHGTESLTAAEQDILARASERYKNRT